MAEGRAVFWELGLADKEKDPNDPTGKRFQAICRCKVDKDDPTITCNKKIGICLIWMLLKLTNDIWNIRNFRKFRIVFDFSE